MLYPREHSAPVKFEAASGKAKSRAKLETVNLSASAALEVVQAAEGEPPKRPSFVINAYNGGLLRLNGFYRPVVIDLAGLRAGRVTVLLDHDPGQIVGQGTAKIGKAAVTVAGEVTGEHAEKGEPAHKVVSHAKSGFVWSASVGVAVDRAEYVEAGEKVKVNGQTFTGPVVIVRAGRLGEVSFVGVGADETASAKVAAAAASNTGDGDMTFEQWLQAMGLTAAELTDEQRSKLQAKYDAEQKAADPVAGDGGAADQQLAAGAAGSGGQEQDPLAHRRTEAAAEEERIAAVRKVCGQKHADICAKAIRDGWPAVQAEVEVLRAERPKPPAAHVQEQAPAAEVLEAACVLAAKLPDAQKQYQPQILEAATKQFRQGLGLYELIVQAACANGYSGRGYRDVRAVMRAAFAPELQAGFSTIDIGGILSNVANKFLLEGFFSVEKTWRNICAVRPVSDFKTVTSYRLVGRDQYEPVAPGGELKHGTLGEEKYTNKADTYGLMLTIDRRDIRNDDLGAITTVPRKLGRGSGLKINDVFWTVFLNNGDFFKGANNNVVAAAPLSIDGLTKADIAFLNLVDVDKKPTGVMPAIILVPTALSAMATVLYKSLEIRDTSNSVKYPVANPHQSKFRAEVSRYMSNAAYTGNSSSAWYLLADPGDLPVIEVAFLDGQESPTIETAEADFNVLGVQMRGYHDFGVALQDPKGGLKCSAT